MSRSFSSLLPLLAAGSLYAAAATPADAPAEQASPVTVIIFLVLFVGACVAFGAYIWWNSRKAGANPGAESR
jgi:flagellar basal body-associated protein FliL